MGIFVVLLIVIGIVFLIWYFMKKAEKISKERRESGIDKKNIEAFINEYGQEYYGYNYITGWNTYVEKKGRQVTTWKHLYIILFDTKKDFFDMINIRYTNGNIKMLERQRVFLKEEKIKTEINKDIASITIGNPKEKRRFIIEKIASGCGKNDDSNPFALDHEREFNDFLNFIS